MGFLSNLFGGPKPPAPPKEIGQIARKQMGIMDKMTGLGDELIGGAREYAPQLRLLYTDLANDLKLARERFGGLAEQSFDRLEKFDDLQDRMIGELTEAGSPGRQAHARELVGERALSDTIRRLRGQSYANAARGMAGQASDPMNNPVVRAQLQLQAQQAGNQAGYAERLRGEQMRYNFFPQLNQAYTTALDRAVSVPARLAEAQASAIGGSANALGQLVAPGIQLYQGAANVGTQGGELMHKQYKNQLMNHQLQAERQAKIISGITGAAASFLGGGFGVPGAGFSMGGAFGGLANNLSGGIIDPGIFSGSGVGSFRRFTPTMGGSPDMYSFGT